MPLHFPLGLPANAADINSAPNNNYYLQYSWSLEGYQEKLFSRGKESIPAALLV